MMTYDTLTVGALLVGAVLVGLRLWQRHLDRRIEAARRALFEAQQADMARRALLARAQRPRLVEDDEDSGDQGGAPWAA